MSNPSKNTSSERQIKKIYYDIGKPSAYFGSSKLHSTNPQFQSVRKLRQVLNKQEDYSLQRQVNRKFKRPQVIVSGPNEQYDCDLADMSSISKFNNGVRYLLIAIDVFSRKLYIVPIKNKTSNEMTSALNQLFEIAPIPKKIRTDAGSEFLNKSVQSLFTKLNIYHHVARQDPKANFAERVIRTIKTMIYRYINKTKSYSYVTIIQRIVDTYNSTPHKSLKDIPPNNVNSENSADLWASMYLHKKQYSKHKINFMFKPGDMARVSLTRMPFRKSFQEQWSREIFTIFSSFRIQGIPMYKLQDFHKNFIKGNFYQNELMKVAKDANEFFSIEKIIRKRKRRGKMEYLVKYLGWDSSYNEWIPSENIIDLRKEPKT